MILNSALSECSQSASSQMSARHSPNMLGPTERIRHVAQDDRLSCNYGIGKSVQRGTRYEGARTRTRQFSPLVKPLDSWTVCWLVEARS